ncbi:MAG: hypothetical protein EBU08_12880 [Micrococcales bacterium]|nr:hypothetical protein [Micrococcales bacterium]
MIKLPTILSQSKKQQRAEQRTQLHNNTLKRIVDELAIIRSIKQKPIDDKEVVSKQPLSVVSRKVKQFVGSVTKRDKPATAVESKKEPTKLSGPSTGLVGFAGAAGAIGLLATISPFFKGFITEILKQTFNLVTGIMPQPVQDLVKMFTSGENGPIEQSQRIQSELQSVEQDFGSDPIPKQAQTQRQIESGQRNLERETRRATNELESAQQPSQPQAPTPAPSTPAPAPTAAPTPSATQAAAPRQSALATPVAKPSPAPTTQQATTRQNLTGVQSIIVTALNENGITSPRAHANILATVKAESDFNGVDDAKHDDDDTAGSLGEVSHGAHDGECDKCREDSARPPRLKKRSNEIRINYEVHLIII